MIVSSHFLGVISNHYFIAMLASEANQCVKASTFLYFNFLTFIKCILKHCFSKGRRRGKRYKLYPRNCEVADPHSAFRLVCLHLCSTGSWYSQNLLIETLTTLDPWTYYFLQYLYYISEELPYLFPAWIVSKHCLLIFFFSLNDRYLFQTNLCAKLNSFSQIHCSL